MSPFPYSVPFDIRFRTFRGTNNYIPGKDITYCDFSIKCYTHLHTLVIIVIIAMEIADMLWNLREQHSLLHNFTFLK